MPKELRYINNSIYSVSDGGAPDVQSLMLGDEVQEAYISHAITVAENNTGNTYAKFRGSNHSYYTLSGVSYAVETDGGSEASCMASSLPCYLTGWQTIDGDAFSWAGSNVNQEFVDEYYDGGSETNLNLYAVWGDTKFLRVIASTFSTLQSASGSYSVNVSDSMSYGGISVFRLSPLFKETIDYSNATRHLTLKRNGIEDSSYSDVGIGYGAPKLVGGVKYPTYFGFKSGDTLTIELTISHANCIPQYARNGNTIEYYGFICEEGLSRDFNDKGTQVQLSLSNNTVWSTEIQNAQSDKTLFVPLVQKPVVSITVLPTGTGTVIGGGAYLPGDTCTLSVIPIQGYEVDEVFVNDVSISEPYSFTVLGSTSVVAYFAPINVATLVYSYYCHDGTVSFEFDNYAWHQNVNNDPASKVFCTATPQSAGYSEGTVRVFVANVEAYVRSGGTLIRYIFMGFKSYTGANPDPLTDEYIPSTPDGSTLYRANVTVTGTTKIYAYYDRA